MQMIFWALTIWTGIGEKISELIQSTSGSALLSFVVYTIGLLVLLAIFLIIALVAKKGMKKKSVAEKTIEPLKQIQATEEAPSGTDLKKHTGNETIAEQQIDKSATKDIHEPMKSAFL